MNFNCKTNILLFIQYPPFQQKYMNRWHRVTAHKREHLAKQHMKNVLKNRIQRGMLMKLEHKNIEQEFHIFHIEEDIDDAEEFIFFTRKQGEDCVHRIHEWIDHAHCLFWAFTEHKEFFLKENVKLAHSVCVTHEKTLPIGRRRVNVDWLQFWENLFINQADGCMKHMHGIDLHLFLEHWFIFEAMHRAFSDQAETLF